MFFENSPFLLLFYFSKYHFIIQMFLYENLLVYSTWDFNFLYNHSSNLMSHISCSWFFFAFKNVAVKSVSKIQNGYRSKKFWKAVIRKGGGSEKYFYVLLPWLKHVKFCQKWPFSKKSHMLESGFFDEFSILFFMKVSAPKWALKSQKKCVLKSELKKYF